MQTQQVIWTLSQNCIIKLMVCSIPVSNSGTLERSGSVRGGQSSSDSVTYQLWANSDDDRKDWVKHMRKAIFAEKGGGMIEK